MSSGRLVGFSTILVALAACAELPTEQQPVEADLLVGALSNGVVERANGSGHFDDARFPDALFRSFSFTAKAKADGSATGQYELHNRNFPIRIHGQIECISVVGNEAWFAGATTGSDDPNQIGIVRAFRVIDNGEGAGAPADEVSLTPAVGSAQAWCDAMIPFATTPITEGNVQVR